MSQITLTVVHTLDPVSLEALRGLFAPVTMISTPTELPAPVQPPCVPAPAAPPAEVAPPAYTAPAPPAAPVQPPMYAQPAGSAQPATVPTTDRAYTIDDLARAGAALMDAGKGAEAVAAMQQFGVQRITDLAAEQYAPFAGVLRGLGAKI